MSELLEQFASVAMTRRPAPTPSTRCSGPVTGWPGGDNLHLRFPQKSSLRHRRLGARP